MHKKGKEKAMKKFEIGKYYAPATSPSIEPLKCIKVTNCYVWFYDDEKECEKRFIGSSDIAALILVGCDENGLKTSTLDFCEDGSYMAYVVDEDAEIGAHYKKVANFKHWLKIYDDDELTYRINAQEINIYRAGDFGCIIQTIGKH